jgi:hypothetical protein
MKLNHIILLIGISIAVLASSCGFTVPVAATSNPVGSKVGTASTTRILGVLFPDGGDASIQTAARNGGITKISTVDFRTNIVFFSFVIKHETIVTGE